MLPTLALAVEGVLYTLMITALVQNKIVNIAVIALVNFDFSLYFIIASNLPFNNSLLSFKVTDVGILLYEPPVCMASNRVSPYSLFAATSSFFITLSSQESSHTWRILRSIRYTKGLNQCRHKTICISHL